MQQWAKSTSFELRDTIGKNMDDRRSTTVWEGHKRGVGPSWKVDPTNQRTSMPQQTVGKVFIGLHFCTSGNRKMKGGFDIGPMYSQMYSHPGVLRPERVSGFFASSTRWATLIGKRACFSDRAPLVSGIMDCPSGADR